MKKVRLNRWPLFVIALGAITLVAARMRWPSLLFDSTSLVLFGVAAMGLLVAYLPLKRIKWGEFEAELDRDVDALEQKVVASETATSTPRSVAAPSHPPQAARTVQVNIAKAQFDEWVSLMNSPSSNVEKILSAGILLEKVLQTAAQEFGLATPSGKGPRAVIDRFVAEGLIGREESAAFLDFWSIRNKVVHHGLQPTDEQTARVLDLVWRLVRTFT
jgi:hypothetical protein